MALALKLGFLHLAISYLLLLLVVVNGVDEKSSSSSFNIKDTNYVFFRYDDLKPGLKLPIYFGGAFPDEIPRFLPKEKANSIPFSSKQFSLILKQFGFHPDSPQAKAMDYTLKMCEMKIPGEHRRCVNSLESMIDYVRETFDSLGHNDADEIGFKVLSTSPLPNGTKLLQNYTVLEARRVPSPKMNACHMMVYPYAVFHCHYPDPENRVFEIKVEGEDRALVDAIANCHMNTTTFDPNLTAFRMLGFTPGSAPLCHFLPSDDLIWVPATADDLKDNYERKNVFSY
ncbi:unnamed protein product [Amaranthus hypochondriacus]